MARLDNSRHLADTGVMREESDLTSMNVSLPQSQRDWVENEALRSGCTSASEFFRRLINDAQRRAAQEELERQLIAGLESGKPLPVAPEYWEKKRRELADRHPRKRS